MKAQKLVDAIKAALQKQGYSNAEIETIFADVIPYDQLGIDPLHPVKLEPTDFSTPPAAAPQSIQEAPHIAGRTPEQAAELAGLSPKLPGATPPPNPFERAR